MDLQDVHTAAEWSCVRSLLWEQTATSCTTELLVPAHLLDSCPQAVTDLITLLEETSSCCLQILKISTSASHQTTTTTTATTTKATLLPRLWRAALQCPSLRILRVQGVAATMEEDLMAMDCGTTSAAATTTTATTTSSHLTVLHVAGYGGGVCEALLWNAQHPHLTTFTWDASTQPRHSVNVLSQFLGQAPRLEQLTLTGVMMEEEEDTPSLAVFQQALQSHASLRHVKLCQRSSTTTSATQCLPGLVASLRRIHTLSLVGYHWSAPADMTALVAALPPTLHKLALHSGGTGARSIMSTTAWHMLLFQHPNLQDLDIQGMDLRHMQSPPHGNGNHNSPLVSLHLYDCHIPASALLQQVPMLRNLQTLTANVSCVTRELLETTCRPHANLTRVYLSCRDETTRHTTALSSPSFTLLWQRDSSHGRERVDWTIASSSVPSVALQESWRILAAWLEEQQQNHKNGKLHVHLHVRALHKGTLTALCRDVLHRQVVHSLHMCWVDFMRTLDAAGQDLFLQAMTKNRTLRSATLPSAPRVVQRAAIETVQRNRLQRVLHSTGEEVPSLPAALWPSVLGLASRKAPGVLLAHLPEVWEHLQRREPQPMLI